MILWSHAFKPTMENQMSLHVRPRLRTTALALEVTLMATLGAAVLAGCADDTPRLSDLPTDVAQARPQITAQEARFVLAAKARGASVTGATVADDIETGTTTCWALKNGDVSLGQLAVNDANQPLDNEGEQLRTKELMAAAVDALCPDYASQIPQLHLPG